MHSLAPIDYALMGGYLLLSLTMGVLMSRKASTSLDHYFLGGKRLPWYFLGVAGMANWFDLTGTMIITSFLYMLGPRGLFIEFRGGAVLILAFMLAFTGKWHRRSGCMTGAEWMKYRFGDGPAANGVRVIIALSNLIFTVTLLAVLIRGASLFLGIFFPWPPFYTTLVLITVTTLYTVGSGFYGVVLTDLVQGVVVIASCITVSVLAWQLVPGSAELAATAAQVTGNPDWTHSLPAWHTPMPPGYEAYSPLILMAGFYLLRNVIGGLATGAEPRYFGAKSDRECGLQSLLQGVMVMFRWPLMIGFAVMGIYLVHRLFPDTSGVESAARAIHAHFPDISAAIWHDTTSAIVNHPDRYPAPLIGELRNALGEDWRNRLPLVGVGGTINPEIILPAVLLQMLPSGFKGLVLVAMVAALMSCKNGLVNHAGSYFVRDLYQNLFRPTATNRELILASYASTLSIVVISFYFGVAATNINSLFGWLIMGLISGQLAPQVLRFYWWRCNAWGMITGSAIGNVGAIVQRLLNPDLPEVSQFLLMTALSFAGTIVGSLLTAPTPRPVLENFYRTTRPFGLWGPFRSLFQGEDRRAMDRENRNDLLTVPFALLWQVTLFLLPMQLVIKSYDSFLGTLPLFLLGCAGMYVFWWRPLNATPHPFPIQETAPGESRAVSG